MTKTTSMFSPLAEDTGYREEFATIRVPADDPGPSRSWHDDTQDEDETEIEYESDLVPDAYAPMDLC